MRGRGAEFETVLGLLDSTQQGQGQVLLVEGEPGTAKSLLLAAGSWARACAVEDQGVLLSAAGRDDEAIRCLQRRGRGSGRYPDV